MHFSDLTLCTLHALASADMSQRTRQCDSNRLPATTRQIESSGRGYTVRLPEGGAIESGTIPRYLTLIFPFHPLRTAVCVYRGIC